MIEPSISNFMLLSVLCVPLIWALPSRIAFDGVASWTLLCIFLHSPVTALWLAAVAVLLPILLGAFSIRREGTLAALLCALITGAFVFGRLSDSWVLIGTAFFSLRAIHVVLDWWMNKIEPPTLRESAHYFFFLPVIFAGPINRLPHFKHQIRRRRWDSALFFSGMERVLLGLFAVYVVDGQFLDTFEAHLFGPMDGTSGFMTSWAASAFSWIRLYAVFSGVTHFALGCSAMMGLKLEENFDRPWMARNLIDFWMRWHMTLSRWVQDYVFKPVTALSRQPVLGLTASMMVIGLWHEFSYYYVAWALWQAGGVILSRLMLMRVGDSPMPETVLKVLGPVCVLGWLSAARPVINFAGIVG